jgi:hypothetical protein
LPFVFLTVKVGQRHGRRFYEWIHGRFLRFAQNIIFRSEVVVR